jgi:hypothetical protein
MSINPNVPPPEPVPPLSTPPEPGEVQTTPMPMPTGGLGSYEEERDAEKGLANGSEAGSANARPPLGN